MPLGVSAHPHHYKLYGLYGVVGVVSFINQVGSACASIVFSVLFLIFGPADVASVTQLLKMVNGFEWWLGYLMCPRAYSADYGEVTRRLESTPGDRIKAIPG